MRGRRESAHFRLRSFHVPFLLWVQAQVKNWEKVGLIWRTRSVLPVLMPQELLPPLFLSSARLGLSSSHQRKDKVRWERHLLVRFSSSLSIHPYRDTFTQEKPPFLLVMSTLPFFLSSTPFPLPTYSAERKPNHPTHITSTLMI